MHEIDEHFESIKRRQQQERERAMEEMKADAE